MIRFKLLIFAALAVQLLADFSHDGTVTRVALLTTHPALIAIALANLRVLGMPLILTGALLNLVAITANGGLMPVSPESIAEAGGLGSIEGIASGEAIAGTKSILLAEDEMVLAGLADRIVVFLPIVGSRVVSIGDTLIAAGLGLSMVQILAVNARRLFGEEPDLENATAG